MNRTKLVTFSTSFEIGLSYVNKIFSCISVTKRKEKKILDENIYHKQSGLIIYLSLYDNVSKRIGTVIYSFTIIPHCHVKGACDGDERWLLAVEGHRCLLGLLVILPQPAKLLSSKPISISPLLPPLLTCC